MMVKRRLSTLSIRSAPTGPMAEPIEALLAVGAHPAIEGGAGIEADAAVRLRVAPPGQLADQSAAFGWAEAGVGHVGDDVVPIERDGFAGIGAHGRLL